MQNYHNNKAGKEKESNFFDRVVVALILFFIIFSFFASISHRLVVFRSDFLASILPRVLVDLTNSYRTSSELNQLAINPVLEQAARLKAQDMASKSYFAHTSPQGVTPWHWFDEAGYDFRYAGENLAIHFSDSSDVVRAWMNSPGHRDNILNFNFTEIGIATSRGMYEGRETTFVVQLFGHPSSRQQLALQTQPQIVEANTEEEIASVPSGSSGEEVLSESESSETEVLGAPSEIKDVATIEEENQKFVAVENTQVLEEEAQAVVPYGSTLVERVVTSPSILFSIAYFILGTIVLLLLVMALIVEIKRHHYLHIAYSAGLLVLILILYFVYKELNQVEVLSTFL